MRLNAHQTTAALLALIGLSMLLTMVGILMHDKVIGVKVSYDENRYHADQSDPVEFNVVEFESGGNFFDENQPDRLTVAVPGCYQVQAQVTVLGNGYDIFGEFGAGGNPPSPEFIIAVTKNGEPHDYVAADYLSNENPTQALLNHTGSIECFEAGEYIQLFVTGNRVIESNWPGTRGSLSPVLYMVFVGSLR
jgi:hypothetical protein